MTVHRFSTYEFDEDPTLMNAHLQSNDMDASIRVNSGVIKHSTFQPRQEDLQAPSVAPSSRVYGETYSFTAGDSEVRQHGSVTRHQVSFDGVAGGSVAATLARSGALRTVELIPGQPATRTDVHAAVRQGLIEPDGKGGFRDVVNQRQAVKDFDASTRPQEQKAPEVGSAFDPKEMEAWSQDIAPLDQQVYDSTVARTIEVAASGGGLDAVVTALAKSAGMEREQAAEYVQAGAAMYQRAVERDLSRLGIVGQDLPQFYDWMRRSEPGHMRHALQKVALTHDTGEFVKLGSRWQMTRLRGGRR